MRGFLDDDEDQPAPQRSRDRELTLGAFTLLGIFFGLVVLCALCFGLGYEVGRGGAGPVLALPVGAPAKTSTTPKPSANVQNSVPTPAANNAGTSPEQSGQQPPPAAGPAAIVRQAAAALLPARPTPAQSHSPAPPAGGPYMVQITAVSNPDDGELLVNALKKRGYQVSTRREGDGLIHVRLGPFSTRDDATHWRQKLLDDGYPATLQQ
jgi:cell division septation protein DedD